jgi:hypothetical protein
MYVCTAMQVGLQLLQASHSRLVTPALIRVVIRKPFAFGLQDECVSSSLDYLFLEKVAAQHYSGVSGVLQVHLST